MKIIERIGREDISYVYLAETDSGRPIEFVEAIQPPLPRNKKWVLIVSTLYGCPINCPICDAGGLYQGAISKDDIFAQLDYMIDSRFPNRKIKTEKFKVQFARMGDPAFNSHLIDVLEELPLRYESHGLIVCLSTVAPIKTDDFFERLLEVKHRRYHSGRFQMQFSIHSTDRQKRDFMIPTGKWGFDKIAHYGQRFYRAGDRKIGLNFALAENIPVEPEIIARYFDPEIFLIKLTPLNPTESSLQNSLRNRLINQYSPDIISLVDKFKSFNFETLISIGELEENNIGSNCGQYVRCYRSSQTAVTQT